MMKRFTCPLTVGRSVLALGILLYFIGSAEAAEPLPKKDTVATHPAQKSSPKKATVQPKNQSLHPTTKKRAPALTLPKPASMNALTKSEMHLLIQAREAYWQHAIHQSITDYQKLIHQAPDHPGIYGELGNVYYMTGQYPAAGKAYMAAANALIHLHRDAEAYSLLPLIGSLNREAAVTIAHNLALQKPVPAKKVHTVKHGGPVL